MMKLAVSVMAAIGCAQAGAAVITETASVTYSDTEGGYFPKTVFVPNFDLSVGTLISTTFTLTGSASETLFYSFPNSSPATGTFTNSVEIGGRIIAQPGGPIVPSSGRLQNDFQVYASTAYDPTYNGANPSLDFTFAVSGVTSPLTATSSAPINFSGNLTTSFEYIPVPEPIGASLLLAPVVAMVALRRRHQVFTTA